MRKLFTLVGLAAVFATGAAVAQSTDFAVFTAPLSPSSENPPIEDAHMSGTALVLIHMTRDASGDLTQAVVDFHVDVSTEEPQTMRLMHIHRAVRGVNGSVVIDSKFGTPVDIAPGDHHFFRQNVVTNEDTLAVVEEVLANPSGFYVNMHSVSHGSGIIRGQLERSTGAELSTVQSQLDALQESNEALAAEMAKVKENIARIARRFGVVPIE